jgi:hypothetical protein
VIVPVASIAQRPTPSRQPFPPSVKEIVPSDRRQAAPGSHVHLRAPSVEERAVRRELCEQLDAEIGNEEVAVEIRCHRTREKGHLHAVDVDEARRDHASDRSVAGHDFDARIRLIEALP